jgi:type II secretory pathway component GspD/PulD (secretin)
MSMIHAALTAILATTLLQDPANRDTDRKISTMRLSVEFQDTPLKEVVDFIRETADINVLIDREVDAAAAVTFKVRDITLKTMLSYILKSHELGYIISEGILQIVPIEKARAKVQLKIYDVQDLVAPLRDMPGREITFGEDGIQFVDTPAEVSPEMGDFLVELLEQMTGRKAWEDNSNASMIYQNGLLIVRQTPEVHRKIEALINMIRRLN